MHEDYTYNTGYWQIRPATVIGGGLFLFLTLIFGGAAIYDHGRSNGIVEATNYVAAKCEQKNEFRVLTGLSTFFFQCNKVKDVAVTPWDNVDVNEPLRP